MYAPLPRFLNPLTLPLGTELCLTLRNRSEHVKQSPASRIAGIDTLVQHDQVNPFPGQDLGNLTQMPGRAGSPLQAGHS
jgi:hypothetical protein